MINIFYNKMNLNDTMIISLSDQNVETIENHKDYTILKNKDEIVGINIFNISNYINIPEGYLLYNKSIKDLVQKICNLDIDKYHNKKFVVGKVLECEDIPNTHLHLCKVDVGDKQLQIVCGASNVKKDILVVTALVNTCMPNGMYIKKGKLQGHESFGMLCSEKELMNTQIESKGILILDSNNYQVGQEYLNHYANK